MSGMSVAVPISGGTSPGYEGAALQYSAKNGWVRSSLWPNRDNSRRYMSDAACQADRENHKALEWVDLGNDYNKFATACLLNWPIAVAYNDWSHVVMICDLVEIEPGSFGLRIRNNWGDSFGAKGRFGFGGYAVFREHGGAHSRPSSGFALRQQTAAQAA
jgi:hypothetical protein